jgi:Fe-S cluster biogenesis protein NfuA
MFIQTQDTPNPETLKFLPGQQVMPEGTASFASIDEAKGVSPLATLLLGLAHVESVFLGSDFVSVTKDEKAAWPELKPEILTLMMEHFVAGQPVIVSAEDHKTKAVEDDSPLAAQIRELIETRVRPAVAQDGGDIIFHRFEEGTVYLEMHGACSGCPSSTITLKNGIENMLKHYVPEVEHVEAVS